MIIVIPFNVILNIMYQWIKNKSEWVVVRFLNDEDFTVTGSNEVFTKHTYKIETYGPILVTPHIIPVQQQQIPVVPEPKELETIKSVDQVEPEMLKDIRVPLFISDFKEVKSRRAQDCPVVALANVTMKTYEEAKLLCFHHGWTSTRGLVNGFLEVILNKLNYDLVYREDLTFETVSQLSNKLPMGVFLVYCHAHVMPAVNGSLFNLNGTGNWSVEEVFELQEKEIVDDSK